MTDQERLTQGFNRHRRAAEAVTLANDHDPLCPAARKADMETGGGIVMAFCACPLIAKVREDMLAKCIAAVEAVGVLKDTSWQMRQQALSALHALQEKP